MSKLFVIGNGFDICHNLPTKYQDFYTYIKENKYDNPFEYNYDIKDSNKPISYLELLKNPQKYGYDETDFFYNSDYVVKILINLISEAMGNYEKWENVEEALGKLNYNIYLQDKNFVIDNDSYYNDEEEYLDKISFLQGAVIKINKHLSQWIDSISLEGIEPLEKFKNIFDISNDIFLTFNYTKTLEKIYNAKNICHIHGKQGEELIFGHGSSENYYTETESLAFDKAIMEIHNSLKKNTSYIVKKHTDFFNSLSSLNIAQIYSFGFSFSDVDLVYIKTICDAMPTENTEWILDDYDCVEKQTLYKNKIVRCGFKGTFKILNK